VSRADVRFDLRMSQELHLLVNVAVAVAVALVGGLLAIRLRLPPIVGFLAGVSPVTHDFWRVEDPNQRMNDMINFGKNIALLGGALALMAIEEPWPASVPLAQPGRVDRLRKLARRAIAA